MVTLSPINPNLTAKTEDVRGRDCLANVLLVNIVVLFVISFGLVLLVVNSYSLLLFVVVGVMYHYFVIVVVCLLSTRKRLCNQTSRLDAPSSRSSKTKKQHNGRHFGTKPKNNSLKRSLEDCQEEDSL